MLIRIKNKKTKKDNLCILLLSCLFNHESFILQTTNCVYSTLVLLGFICTCFIIFYLADNLTAVDQSTSNDLFGITSTTVDQSISNDLFNACSIVHVVLNNNTVNNTANNTPLHLHEDYTYGSYEESSDFINGKRSWIDQVFGKAIWIQNNNWIIGLIGHIGTNDATFYAHNNFSGLSDSNNQWHYKGDGQWILPEDPNDIRIEMSGDETFQSNFGTYLEFHL